MRPNQSQLLYRFQRQSLIIVLQKNNALSRGFPGQLYVFIIADILLPKRSKRRDAIKESDPHQHDIEVTQGLVDVMLTDSPFPHCCSKGIVVVMPTFQIQTCRIHIGVKNLHYGNEKWDLRFTLGLLEISRLLTCFHTQCNTFLTCDIKEFLVLHNGINGPTI